MRFTVMMRTLLFLFFPLSCVLLSNPVAYGQGLSGQPTISDDFIHNQESQPPFVDQIPTNTELPSIEIFIPPTEDTQDSELILPFDEALPEIKQIEFRGNTVFSSDDLNAAISVPVAAGTLTFRELLEARDAITQTYIDAGYVTSGALLLPQTVEDDGVLTFEIVEGQIESINVVGNRRLNDGYVRSRIAVGLSTPLQRDQLEEQINLLLLNPLIDSISADVQPGSQLGSNVLVVAVTEVEDTASARYTVDNNRSPSVGSWRNQLRFTEANLLGLGDSLSIGYGFTAGSDNWTARYTLPVNARNGILELAAGNTDSRVIEAPFDRLDINAESTFYDISYRQPVIQRATQTRTESLVLSLTASHQQSQTFLGIDDIGPFPLSPGANSQGQTRVSALRFSQDWVQNSNRQALALRSQFSLGVGLLDATNNAEGPDSQFFSWKGQGQWVRDMGNDIRLVVDGGLQLSDDSLLTAEKFGLGGQSTVRGYRQDQLLTDNGLLSSVEVRFPVVVNREKGMRLQIAPFC